MAGEIQLNFSSGKTCYALVRNRVGQIWNTSTGAFEAYAVANYANYVIALTEQTNSGGFYVGNMPAAIVAGVYSFTGKQALAGSGNEASTDPAVGFEGAYQWSGTATFPLSDLLTSGQFSQGFPQRLARGVMVQNFPIYLKSSVDHVTPFTSGGGGISGQIARDGGSFGPLQSGDITERGMGWYDLTLTSGDLLANTIKLLFTGTAISGGTCDPLPIGLVLQKTSGQQ